MRGGEAKKNKKKTKIKKRMQKMMVRKTIVMISSQNMVKHWKTEAYDENEEYKGDKNINFYVGDGFESFGRKDPL